MTVFSVSYLMRNPMQEPSALAPPSLADCAVMELRQYTLHPHQRDVLIDLFDREFVETQEADGMRVLGQFRDLDRPEVFVWLRGFADMPARHRALDGFYGGPVWAAHRNAANATMIDSDNVLLLRPAWPGAAAALPQHPRPMPGDNAPASGMLAATVFHLRAPAPSALTVFCRDHSAAATQHGGALRVGWLCTEASPNTFARLPVREGEHVLLALALHAEAVPRELLAASATALCDAAPGLAAALVRAPEILRLQPTARSALHA